MAVFIILWPYLLTTKLRGLQLNNVGHTIISTGDMKFKEYLGFPQIISERFFKILDHCDTGSNSRPSHRLRPGGGGPGRCHAPNQSHQRRTAKISKTKITQFGGYQYY